MDDFASSSSVETAFCIVPYLVEQRSSSTLSFVLYDWRFQYFDDLIDKLIIPTFNSKERNSRNSPSSGTVLLLFPPVFGLSFSIGVRLLVCRELSQDASNESASFAMRSLLLRRGHLFMTPLQDRQEHRFQRGIVLRTVVLLCELRPPNICTPYYMTFSTFPDAKTTFVTSICLLWLSFLAVQMIPQCNTNYLEWSGIHFKIRLFIIS